MRSRRHPMFGDTRCYWLRARNIKVGFRRLLAEFEFGKMGDARPAEGGAA